MKFYKEIAKQQQMSKHIQFRQRVAENLIKYFGYTATCKILMDYPIAFDVVIPPGVKVSKKSYVKVCVCMN